MLVAPETEEVEEEELLEVEAWDDVPVAVEVEESVVWLDVPAEDVRELWVDSLVDGLEVVVVEAGGGDVRT